ncbi:MULTISPECIES: hypothetical protein [unclassified Treponema]|uniref:hypothetical protein n=1 Tax=unclassified Treponema TaxID=2638727 RepID=UPI000E95019A|nr:MULTISPECIES: hypothetical protein [unclassified Treponema]HBP09538.1 hypothetical protein [Treponema sp.]
MKKNLCFIFGLCFFIQFFAAQNSNENTAAFGTQVMVPRDVFIGDSGQIQYSFRTPVDFFSFADSSMIKDEVLSLNLSSKELLENPDDCLVTKSVLVRNGVNYNLCITIIPWKTGTIKFKEFNLEKFCRGQKKNEVESVDFKIQLAPVTILSLVEKLEVKNLKSPQAPLLLPNTNYFLWIALFLVAGFFSLSCIVLIRLPHILKKLKFLKEQFELYRNAKRTKKKLSALLKKKIDDKDFCEKWQLAMREYLEFRFAVSFCSVPGKNVGAKIFDITSGLVGEKVCEAIESLSCFFVRTDYIRFASGSIDSKLLPAETHQALFVKNEKKSMIVETCKIIDLLEKGESNKNFA